MPSTADDDLAEMRKAALRTLADLRCEFASLSFMTRILIHASVVGDCPNAFISNGQKWGHSEGVMRAGLEF